MSFMLATLSSSTVAGVQAKDVIVEVDVSGGLPAFEIVGLPSTSVRESRDRVRTSVKNAGFTFPIGRVTVNLAPAHLRKSGTLFDLPIAIGILIAGGQLQIASWARDAHFIGELSLDGMLRSVRGALCVASSLIGTDRILVAPACDEDEIKAVSKLKYVTAHTLRELVSKLSSDFVPSMSPGVVGTPTVNFTDPWKHVKGQDTAKRALQIAIAGGHHVMMMGPPGAGKTMLARGASKLALPLSPAEAIDVSAVYSVAGMLRAESPVILKRPFRSPHHSITTAALLGGGVVPRPGEVSLAHKGILFLDEFAQFQGRVLDGLREPLEEGAITLSRMHGSVRLPAKFTLIAALNPCPCGFLHDPEKACTCRPGEIDRYRRRLSGPLLDRIDIFVKLARVDYNLIVGGDRGESDSKRYIVKNDTPMQQIERAVIIQHKRLGDGTNNSEMTPNQISRFACLESSSETFLLRAARKFVLSARAVHRTIKVARTIADMEGAESIDTDHLSEALAYRSESVLDI